MGTTTTRFGLTMPDPADTVDVTKINADMVLIDGALGLTPCTSGTLPSTPAAGQAAYTSDSHDAYVWDTSGAVGQWHYLVPTTVAVASDVTVTNTATATQVGDLTVTMAPSTTYALDAFIVYSTATTADAVLSFFLPSGASVLLTSGALNSASTTAQSPFDASVATSPGLTLGGAGVGVNVAATLRGTVTTGVAGGNIVGTWAQSVATASATVVKAGSWLRLQRI